MASISRNREYKNSKKSLFLWKIWGGDKVADFRFNEDFANNWKSGQIVTCEEKEEGYLVDKVTLIEKD